MGNIQWRNHEGGRQWVMAPPIGRKSLTESSKISELNESSFIKKRKIKTGLN